MPVNHTGNCTDQPAPWLNYSVESYQWWGCFCGAVLCLVMSGLASGINIGLMSLSPLSLRLLADAAPSEKRRDPTLRLQARRASIVLPLITRKHLVMVTLLLTTAIADEVLPLCIDAIAPTWVAVIVSVTTMLLFTEVIPTAMFTDHRSNLKLAAGLAPLVWALMGILGVFTWPMAKALTVFVERTQRKVGDAESAAGSIKADEVDPDSNEKDRTQVEARQLLKTSRFTALLHILRSEVIVMRRKASCMDATQVFLLERVAEMGRVRVADVLEPLAAPRLLALDTTVDHPGGWVSALAQHTARNNLGWFVVEGLHGSRTWDVFHTAAVLKAGSQGSATLMEALLECCPPRYEPPLFVSAAASLCDAETLRRTMAPHAPVVLVHAEDDDASPSADQQIVGVVHMLDAMRAHVADQMYWADARVNPQHAVQQQSAVSTRSAALRADSVHHDDDSEGDDVEALLNAPRIANAVPWSIKYANVHRGGW